MNRFIQLFLVLFVSAGLIIPAHAALPLVVIKTYGEHRAGNIVYHHRVTNNSACKVASFSIGEETDRVNMGVDYNILYGEIGTYPLGYVPVDIDAGTGAPISQGATVGLPGWTADIMEIDNGSAYLEWTSISDTPGAPSGQRLLPGQTADFSVTVPSMDAVYLTGHFSAYLGGGRGSPCPTQYNDFMQKLDTTPPALTVTFTPATFRANGSMVTVNATIAVKDDYDPQPEIKLEYISPAKPSDVVGAAIGTDDRQFQVSATTLGVPKTYFAIYSATDGSGNYTRARATITITP